MTDGCQFEPQTITSEQTVNNSLFKALKSGEHLFLPRAEIWDFTCRMLLCAYNETRTCQNMPSWKVLSNRLLLSNRFIASSQRRAQSVPVLSRQSAWSSSHQEVWPAYTGREWGLIRFRLDPDSPLWIIKSTPYNIVLQINISMTFSLNGSWSWWTLLYLGQSFSS